MDDILAAVMKDKPFFDTSGGGVTFSGGEPTVCMEFLSELARNFQEKGVHTLIETCGLFDFHGFTETVYPHLDTIYMDIKLMDNEAHRRHCGAGNTVILENFRKLFRLYRDGGKEVLPRIPLIPGITDTESNLAETVRFLKDCGAEQVSLLPYHPLWQDKNKAIGMENPLGRENQMTTFLAREKIDACRALFTKKGIIVI